MAKNQDGVIKKAKQYCCQSIEKIEGYDKMLKSSKEWCCHHRREIYDNKSRKQLIDEGLYYNRPASELIFLTQKKHRSLHAKHPTDEAREKKSAAFTGEKNPMFADNPENYMSDEAVKEKHRKQSEKMKEFWSRKREIDPSMKKKTERKSQKTPIVQLTMQGQLFREFEKMSDALQYGFNLGCIYLCCHGKTKSHGGYRWQYADEYKKNC